MLQLGLAISQVLHKVVHEFTHQLDWHILVIEIWDPTYRLVKQSYHREGITSIILGILNDGLKLYDKSIEVFTIDSIVGVLIQRQLTQLILHVLLA